MSNLQDRLVDWMIQLIRDFGGRTLSYHGLVQNLRKLMEAAGIEDETFRQGFMREWKELDRLDTGYLSGGGPDLMMIQPSVEKMRAFLLQWKEIIGNKPRFPGNKMAAKSV